MYIWEEKHTYAGGKPQLRVQKDMRGGNSIRTYFPVFPSRLRVKESGSVTVGNEEEYLKTEFKSGGRKSGGGSSATLIIFCRFLKYSLCPKI